MKIAIFGSTGFVGQILINKAIAAGYEVKTLAMIFRQSWFFETLELMVRDGGYNQKHINMYLNTVLQ